MGYRVMTGLGPRTFQAQQLLLAMMGKGGTTQVLTEEEYEIFNDQEAEDGDDAGDNFYA